MVFYEIPDPTSPETVSSLLEEHGQMRLSEIRDELDHDRDLGNALLELVEAGEVGVFPVGDVVLVKPE